MNEDIQIIWNAVLPLLEEEVSSIGYKTWIQTLVPKSIRGKSFYIISPTSVQRNIVDARYGDLIKNCVTEVCGEEYDIKITVEDQEQEAPKPLEKASVTGMPLNPKYTFDTFVVGNSNRFAHAAALAVAETPALAYNPLFLYGGVGLGKTHLLHAIGNYILNTKPNSKIAYISSETFTNELIRSIREKEMDKFRNKYRSMDVLMIDDIQFIAGKVQTEEEFFHTFNALYDANKQIIITSDKHPEEMKTLEERLKSRFEWGLPADINSPDFETRVAILQKKVELEGIMISDDILQFIAEKITSNIRELEGVLNKVIAYRGLVNKEITMDVASEVLKYYESDPERRVITPETIIENCAKFFDVKKEDILGKRKTKDIARARQVCMYLFREILNYSQLKTGKYFDKHHTTIMYGISEIEKEIEMNPEFKMQIDILENDIKNG